VSNPVVAELEAHLARIHREAKGDLKKERRALYMLAVEREELATVGYGGDDVQARIGRLNAPEPVRRLVAHALRWAARDERTHSVLARGLLMAQGGGLMALLALGTNAAGLIAGWSSAVMQHTTFRRAPLSTLTATLIGQLGRLMGKVPKTALSTLGSQRFLQFCRFQNDAEETAALSWERIADLGEGPLATRIAADERKHRQVFALFLESFDENDASLPGLKADELAAKLSAIDPSFVPRGGGHGIGDGGRVVVRKTDDPSSVEQRRALLHHTLVDSGLLAEVLGQRGPGFRVAIKTSFMMSYDRRDPSPHVDLELSRELALLLRAHGAGDVAFIDSPNHYDWYFSGRSVSEVAKYIGLDDPSYRVVDSSTDLTPYSFRRGFGQESVCATWKDADLRISFAKMRSHPSWLCHLSLNTLESLGRRIDELLFLNRQADLVSGLMMLLDAFPPDLALVDATHHVPDGLTGVLGDPTPCHPGRLYAARDALALDLVASRHMGLSRFAKGSALSMAIDWFDDPRPRTVVDGVDEAIAGFQSPHRNDATVLLSAMAYPVYSWGGDRGGWWLPVMDAKAFPLRRRERLVEAVVRRVLRGLFGFGRPAKEAR